jgi:hypothetical protein
MTRRFLLSCCALVVAAGVWATPARADSVDWSYSWSPGSSAVPSTTGSGFVLLSGQAQTSVSGDSDVVAANVRTVGTTASTFSNAAYSLTITLKDDASNKTGSLTFMGAFNGTLSGNSAKITNMFTGLTTQSITLGGNQYTVTMTSYVAPGGPNAFNSGAIGASVSVSNLGIGEPQGGPPSQAPEPASLLLAGLGGAALLGWRVRRRGKMAA